ncbi:MAG: branched-chain amino acid ABC transporter permease [Spirochaetia bacterium]|jgi:branched-chain amino acid transport system permease protein|uniref:High-affinity branched-chain amino acid transport system permease protein LivH n=1 Tax=bioreactor metagenome TaxID=1076179 RepID=A0A644TCS0_9ZZZZ|nr:branched-chain amino acid ABC transporter permease [Spirochaetia bacterium]MDD3820175.1 branched-chain amino acid ABC transporter permease [Spirochaetales bacterium]NLX46478.1 branched-chain amino acid ABC transporter permease [Treponema sp.]VBB38577.1 High-affinity branched-chain amino acid transport system permease protein BraD [uncultured Spirochaetota bacterium]MCE1208812.1 branched-chain amino acid ABC transporter permease [Spirochaetia bacterium]
MGAIFNAQQIVNGLQVGSIYALIALGYTMVYGIVRLINFAHGDFYMLGAYAAYGAFFAFNALFVGKTGLMAFVVLIASMAAGGVIALLANRLAYKPLRYKPKLSSLITAIGVSMFLEYFLSALPAVGPSYRSFPDILPRVNINLGNAVISNYVIIDIVIAAVLMVGLTLLIKKTTLGKAMRAVSQDKDAARLMGIDIEKVIAFTFLIGGSFAGAAGLLAGMTYPRIVPYMGIQPGLKAFIAAVLGGIGNIPGAVLGAYIMGLAETFASAYNSLIGEGIAFAILIIVLLVRPRGLLGEKIADKI